MRLLIVILSFLLYIPSVWAWDFCVPNEDSVMLYYNVVDEEELSCEVALCKGAEYRCDILRIPEQVVLNRGNWDNGDPDTMMTVVGIGKHAFHYNHLHPETSNAACEFDTVILPYGLSYIDDYGFAGSYMTKLVWPEDNRWFHHIGQFVFRDTGLRELTIPKSTQTLSEYSFTDTALQSVVFEEGNTHLTRIPQHCFYRCSTLNYVKFCSSVTEIEKEAFLDCAGLHTVEFGSGLKSIGENAFEGCKWLEAPKLPYGLEFIRNKAFGSHYLYYAWDELEIPATIRDIGEYVLVGIRRLYVNKEVPPYCLSEKTFGDYGYDNKEKKCTRVIKGRKLIVPMGCVEEYATTYPWDRFDRSCITARDLSAIKPTKVKTSQPEGVFSLDGRRWAKSQKGLNIIRYKDGTARKVVVKK